MTKIVSIHTFTPNRRVLAASLLSGLIILLFIIHFRTDTEVAVLGILLSLAIIILSLSNMKALRHSLANEDSLREHVYDDLEQWKGALKTIQESQERFKRFFEVSEEGIFIHDQGIVVDVNPALEKMVDYKASELIGTDGPITTLRPRNTLSRPFTRNLSTSTCQRWSGSWPRKGI